MQVIVSNPNYWKASDLEDMRAAIDAFPPGMIEQSLDFYEMMFGSKMKVYLRQPLIGRDTTHAITSYDSGKRQLWIDIYNSGQIAGTFAHELTHVFHFYLIDSAGDANLPALYDLANGGNVSYVGDKCFDARYEKYVGDYFVTAYSMHSYDEDLAELFSMLCVDSGLYGRLQSLNGPLYQKVCYAADEFLRRTIRPAVIPPDLQWWYDTFDNSREFSRISPNLSWWALAPYREAMDKNLLPPDGFLSDNPRAPISRLDYSYLAARLLENYHGGSLRGLAASLGVTGKINIRSNVPYNDLPKSERLDIYVNLFYMREMGVIQGSGGLFKPQEILDRAQAATLMTNIAKALGLYYPPPEITYADADEIPEWALEGVAFMTGIGVMKGADGNRFLPNEPYTYEQGLISMLNMYNWLAARSVTVMAA